MTENHPRHAPEDTASTGALPVESSGESSVGAEATARSGRRGALALAGTIAVAATVFDQSVKAWVVSHLVEGQRQTQLAPVVEFVYVNNSGAAFSFAAGATWVFTVFAVVMLGVLGWLIVARIRSRRWALAAGLVVGGVLGNLIDRLIREPGPGVGRVVDFIATPWMMPAVYNVADICICTGMALIVLLSLVGIGLDGQPSRARKESDD